MSEIQPFVFPTTGQPVRTLLVDGEPWVVASDVAAILGYANGSRDVNRHVPERHRRGYRIGTPSGDQQMTVISEPGVWRLVMRSNQAQAEAFQNWLAEDVIPAIRKTGSYSVTQLSRKELARMVIESEEALERAETRALAAEHEILELAPAAHAWDVLASADGDFSAREAANILNRDPNISTGQNRLMALMRDWGLIDQRNRPYATHAQHVRLRPQTRPDYAADDGSRKEAAPQPRITVQGIRYLHKRLAGRSDVNALISEELSEEIAA